MNKRLTLEQRIIRLERLLPKNEKRLTFDELVDEVKYYVLRGYDFDTIVDQLRAWDITATRAELKKAIAAAKAADVGVDESEIPQKIKSAFEKRFKADFDAYAQNHPDTYNVRDRMAHCFSMLCHNDIHDPILNRLWNDLIGTGRPLKTPYFINLHDSYQAKLDELIEANKRNKPDLGLDEDITDWFDDNMGPDKYDSKRAWMSDLRWMAKGAPNGSTLDDCCDELGIDDVDKVTKTLAALAKDALDDISYNKVHGQDSVGRFWTDPWA